MRDDFKALLEVTRCEFEGMAPGGMAWSDFFETCVKDGRVILTGLRISASKIPGAQPKRA